MTPEITLRYNSLQWRYLCETVGGRRAIKALAALMKESAEAVDPGDVARALGVTLPSVLVLTLLYATTGLAQDRPARRCHGRAGR